MQFELKPYEMPGVPQFNYEELKTVLTEKCRQYETIVYMDDDIKQAKSDRADLNKLKRALNEERIRLEKEYMAPFKQFKAQIDEIIAIVDKPTALIDSQIKEYEQRKKDEKREQIKAVFAEAALPEYITLEKIWDESWLNSTCTLSRIKEDLKTLAYRDAQAMESIKTLPEYAFEAAEFYKQSLDITAALAKANELARIAKAKKEAEAKVEIVEEIPASESITEAEVEEPTEVVRAWIKFEANLSESEARELAAFFRYNKIEFRPIK